MDRKGTTRGCESDKKEFKYDEIGRYYVFSKISEVQEIKSVKEEQLMRETEVDENKNK